MKELTHPSIVPLLLWGLDSSRLFIMTAYAEEGSLDRALSKGSTFSEKECWVVLEQMVQALSYLHGMLIIHRDIKPGNIVKTLKGGK
jgi:serine/threonine protein kinase